MRKKLGKWGPLIALGLFMLAALIFIMTAGNGNRGITIHYVDGTREMEVKGEHYILINDVDSKDYIGSMVSTVLKCDRGEKVGTISSWWILTMAVVYEVQGDPNRDFLVDSRERIYIRKNLYEAKAAELEKAETFPDYRIVGKAKNYNALIDIDDEKGAALLAWANDGSSEGLYQTDSIDVTQNFNNRREIFAFTSDGLLYKASMELFLYQDQVYVTTRYEDRTDEKKLSILTGKLLPEELQEYFRGYWN